MLCDGIIEDGLDGHMVGTNRAFLKPIVVIVERSNLFLECLLFLTLKIILKNIFFCHSEQIILITPQSPHYLISAHCINVYLRPVHQTIFLGTAESKRHFEVPGKYCSQEMLSLFLKSLAVKMQCK